MKGNIAFRTLLAFQVAIWTALFIGLFVVGYATTLKTYQQTCSTSTCTVPAGSTFTVVADHTGTDTTEYRLRVDGTVVDTKPVSALSGGVISFARPAAQPGTYTIAIEAVGPGGTTLSSVTTVTVPSPPPPPTQPPAAPTNVRIIIDDLEPPPPPPSGDTNAFFVTQCQTPGATCYSLREQAMIDQYRHPGEVKVNYDPVVDAAKWQWIKDDESADNLRLPISLARPTNGSSRLLIIADHRWDSAWFTEFKDPNGEFLGGWKWMQVTSASGPGSSQQRIWFEPQMRAIGENPFGDNPPVLSLFGAREYLDVLAPTTNEGAVGCGIDFGESIGINHQMGCFKAYPNTWTRSWIEIILDANTQVLPNGAHVAKVSWWLADENQDATPIFLNAQLGYFSPILQFWYEYDTSRPERIGGPMAAWGKNVIALKDVTDVPSRLQRPVR